MHSNFSKLILLLSSKPDNATTFFYKSYERASKQILKKQSHAD